MTQAAEITRDVVKSKEVIGVKVESPTGDNLGEIKELVLDKRRGIVRYAVLSFGGFLSMGDKLFALPWNSFHYEEDRDCFVMDVSKEKLEKAPGFDKDHWPNFANREWAQSIYDYYGIDPYWNSER